MKWIVPSKWRVQCASLAEAARKMEVTPSAVTQRLQALEAQIGIRLIDRSGRRLVLTDEGQLVASHGTIVTEAMETLSEALANRKKAVSGHLRIAAPHGFGRLLSHRCSMGLPRHTLA